MTRREGGKDDLAPAARGGRDGIADHVDSPDCSAGFALLHFAADISIGMLASSRAVLVHI